jgi:SynChlorMet cassette radical SAM/SPASM protein ScmF
MEPNPVEPNPVLHNVYIYANEECNLACKHCWITPTFSNTVKHRYVTFPMYRDFIDQAIPLGLAYVKISGGEALLSRSEVLELIRYTHKHNISTRIETNGTLIDEEVANTIAETKTSISISLDGSTAEIHEKMRLVPGCFEATMRGLRLLRERKVPLEIITSVYKDNVDDFPNIVKIAAKLRARVKINPVLATGRGTKMDEKGERLSAVELYKFVKEIEETYYSSEIPVTVSSEPAFHSLDYVRTKRVSGGSCYFKSLLGILSTGDISFCGMGKKAPEYVFGHISDINLRSVWTSHPTLQTIRKKVPDQLEGICGNCLLKTTCQGACRASAFATYGSITAPSPGCQELYESGLFPKSRMIDPSKRCDYNGQKGALPVLQ